MSTRKAFIAAAASVPLVAAAAPPEKPKISETARVLAQRMRAFDPSLTSKQLEEIAKGLDDNLKLGDAVNPHGTALKNWNEPAAVFEVRP